MQLATRNHDIGMQFNCVSSKNIAKEKNSEEIAVQIAEFEKRGGIIKEIPNGIGALSAGQVIVSEESHSMAVPRNSKQNKKTTTSKNSPYITVLEAAKLIGMSSSFITRQIKKGNLNTHKQEGSRANFVSRKQVIALKKSFKGKAK